MRVSDLFTVKHGVNLELMRCETTQIFDSDAVNFVARTSENNGVVATVKQIEGVIPHPAGTISCAAHGSVMSSFVQTKPYYSGRALYVLTPKQEMSLCEKLYYCMCLKANAYRYDYGRSAEKTLRDIDLPNTIPDWVYSVSIEPIKTKISHKLLTFSTADWQWFQVGEIFRLENCKCSVASDLSDGDDCYYIGAKKNDNGIMRRVVYDDSLMTKGNCIVFICNGQGSVGYTNYMNEDFIGTTSLMVGRNAALNQYIGMFLVTILDLERPKYSYGRSNRPKLASTLIKLPTTPHGRPDWSYMENYIKSLPYSDRI